jgi:hypothetical protein
MVCPVSIDKELQKIKQPKKGIINMVGAINTNIIDVHQHCFLLNTKKHWTNVASKLEPFWTLRFQIGLSEDIWQEWMRPVSQ